MDLARNSRRSPTATLSFSSEGLFLKRETDFSKGLHLSLRLQPSAMDNGRIKPGTAVIPASLDITSCITIPCVSQNWQNLGFLPYLKD